MGKVDAAMPSQEGGGKGWKRYWKLWQKQGKAPTPPDLPAEGSRVHTAGLPSTLPTFASGTGFATRKFNLGEVSLVRSETFQQVWNSGSGQSGASFYNPVDIPEGYYSLGSYAQLNAIPPRGWVLAIAGSFDGPSPPLSKPMDYTLVWTSADWAGAEQNVIAFFWAPVVPSGYKALGFVVTTSPDKPGRDDVVLVRADLTEESVVNKLVWDTSEMDKVPPFSAWTTKPSIVGVHGMGVPVNSFYCIPALTSEMPLSIACLKNVNNVLDLMPTFGQLEQIVTNYGPTVFCHPEEESLPTTPEWFFEHGARLYSAESPDTPVRVAPGGSNLPPGGDGNDGMYWLDLPTDGTQEVVKKGDLSVAKVLIHVKPMFGASFTDVCCWIYHCFNGSCVAKLGPVKSLALGKIGQHVSDWEHFTIRVDNFSGELRRIYFGEHAAGVWFRPDQLEYVSSNRAVVYSAKNSHALYSKEGTNLQGDEKIGVGIRNDTSRSTLTMDTSTKHELINVDYLSTKGETGYPQQPPWVDYIRQWGPKITYDSKTELDKILNLLPKILRKSVMNLINKLPDELGGEEGPSGPKEKASWYGDEKEF
ncbi:unnamed protein product [Calypogeia fissa]